MVIEGKCDRFIVFVFGVEGLGLCEKIKEIVDVLVKIDFVGGFGFLNVFNVVVVVLYVVKEL